jgi:phosphoglycolate phosphatase
MRPDLAQIDAVIFDLDGTLIDSAADIAHALNVALASAGLRGFDLDTVRDWIGHGPNALMASALLAQGLDGHDVALRERLHDRFIEASHAAPFEHGQIYPGIVESLQALQPHLPLAVVTNKPTPLARLVIEAAGLHTYLRHVQGADSPAQRKPFPLTLQTSAAALGVAVSRVLMVGDSPPDVLAAQAAGCPAVLVDWGYGAQAVSAELPAWRISQPAEIADGLRLAGRLAPN